jgi:predicted PurR-regulated permease PerM
MKINKKPIYINITTLTVIKIIMVFILFYFLFLVREILAILFVALILASAINPIVDWLHLRKIPRWLGVLSIYFTATSVVAVVLYLAVPPIVSQVTELSENFPSIAEKALSSLSALREYSSQYGFLDNIKKGAGIFEDNIHSAAGGIFSTVSGLIGGIFSFFLVLVIAFYMVVEENAMKKIVWSVSPKKYQIYVMNLINRMQHKIGLWLRGQLILSFIIFLLTYTGLSFLNIKYALVLALIAALVEFIPYFGPIFSSVPAILLAMNQSLAFALFVAILYLIIQWVENNIVVPKVMQKVVGLNPIVSIAVLLIGFKLAGVVGAILAIPVATAVSVFIKDIFDSKIEEDKKHV